MQKNYKNESFRLLFRYSFKRFDSKECTGPSGYVFQQSLFTSIVSTFNSKKHPNNDKITVKTAVDLFSCVFLPHVEQNAGLRSFVVGKLKNEGDRDLMNIIILVYSGPFFKRLSQTPQTWIWISTNRGSYNLKVPEDPLEVWDGVSYDGN